MSLFRVARQLSVACSVIAANLRTALEYRVSFILKIVSAFIIDIGFFFVWYIFYEQFPVVNNWRFSDTALLLSVAWMGLGLSGLFAFGAYRLSCNITEGKIDSYLLLPQPILLHLAISQTDVSCVGPILSSSLMFWASGYASWLSIPIFIVVSIMSALITTNFIIITQSLAFFIGNFEETADVLKHMLMFSIPYPPTIWGPMKFITMTIIPSFFIATVPMGLIKNFDIISLMLFIGFWLFSTWLARSVFYRGLRSYESGNLVTLKI